MKKGYKIEIYPFYNSGKKKEFAYRIKYNDRILYHSEGYATKQNAQRALRKIMNMMKELAPIFEFENDVAYIQYEAKRNEYRRKVLVEG
jgi:uncharacterized protein YegP (UPF0339 family)